MKPAQASDSDVLWNAVGKQPIDQSMAKMKEDGWLPIAQSASKVVMQHKRKRATLYLANGKVGMVQVDNR